MKDYSHYDFSKFDPTQKHNLYVDADTIIYSRAAACEKAECPVTHIKSGRKKTFENFPAFMDFLANDEKGKNFKLEDFRVPVLSYALSNIDSEFKKLFELEWVQKINIYVGGVGNFRRNLDPLYKANRPPKPLLFEFCYNHVIGRYNRNIEMCHGYEAEDHCLADALKDPKGVIAYVDKDLENVSALFFNYNRKEQGVFWISPEQAFYNLCVQLMIGDRSTDNIKGIDFVSPEVKERFKLSTKSIGAGSAAKILQDVDNDIPKMKERLLEVYKLSYKDTWKEALDFTGKLIYITTERYKPFDVHTFLED